MGALLLLAKENYISYSKPIAKTVGVDEAIIFGELCSINNMLNGIEWFYFEQPKIINDTCLSKHRVIKALKNLKDFGLVSYEKRGIPAKNYYKLHEEKLLELMKDYKDELQGEKTETTSSPKIEPQEVDTPSGLKIEPLEVQNLNHSKSKNETTINNKNTNKNNINKNTNNNIVAIINYLNEKTGKNYKATTKATVNLIKARLKEDFTVDDFKTVIDNQVAKWRGNPSMEEYLRPSTLFNSEKFEGYLNSKPNQQTSYDVDKWEQDTKNIWDQISV